MDVILQLVKDYGLGLVVFAYFIYLFNKQNKLMETERGELKDRIVFLETKMNDLNEFIQTKLMDTIKKNDASYEKLSDSLAELSLKLNRKRNTDQDERAK